MENKQFTPCPACGAVGEVGNKCQFCGSTITTKEGVVCTNSRIIKQRTVTPQQYAEKISIYQDVKGIGYGLNQVSIGDQKGIVNLNGDIILPLESMSDSNFVGINDFVVKKERKSIETKTDIKRNLNGELETIYHEKIVYTTIEYINLKTLEKADKYGFIMDKNDIEKLYLINVKDWSIENKYINYEKEIKSFDYAERYIIDGKYCQENKDYYIFHRENTLSFGCVGIYEYKKERFAKVYFEGIQSIGNIIETKDKLSLPIKMPNSK